MQWDWSIDGWIVAAGALCALAASLLGNFLLLRRLSLMGDAISHAVLPGIAAAFLFSGHRGSVVVLMGAAVMGLLTVWFTEWIQHYGKVEESAAIGIVFTSLFAIGLVMMVRAGDTIDLDPSCVLYGNLETVIMDTTDTPIGPVPRVVLTLGCICLLNTAVVVLLFKQWQLSTFDPLLSQAQGISPLVFRYLLASLVAITCIASFEAVGNILVVAMLVVPAATAFLLCNRLSNMIWMSALVAVASAVLGHLLAISLPRLFGFRSANSAAMIAVASGLILSISVIASPKSGLLFRWWSQRKVARQILREDLLALLYRQQERSVDAHTVAADSSVALEQNLVADQLGLSLNKLKSIAMELARLGWIRWTNTSLQLTAEGHREAQNLIRSHRLWEQYLASQIPVSDARLHAQAESLEHFTGPSLRGKLDEETGQSSTDPHGRNIPPEGR